MGRGNAREYNVRCDNGGENQCLVDGDTCALFGSDTLVIGSHLKAASGGVYRFSASDITALRTNPPNIVDNLGSDEVALAACEAFVLARRRSCALSCEPLKSPDIDVHVLRCDQSGHLLPSGCLETFGQGMTCPPAPRDPYVSYLSTNNGGQVVSFDGLATVQNDAVTPSQNPEWECEELLHALRDSCFPNPTHSTSTAPETTETVLAAGLKNSQGADEEAGASTGSDSSPRGQRVDISNTTLAAVGITAGVVLVGALVALTRLRTTEIQTRRRESQAIRKALAWDDELFSET